MTKSEIIKEAFAIAEKRAEAWCRKHEIHPDLILSIKSLQIFSLSPFCLLRELQTIGHLLTE